VLDRLSYEAHRDAKSADGRGRLSKMAVEWALRQHLAQAGMPEDEAAKAAARVAHYMEQRSGLLQPAADDYEFAHLTLQEHCAGRHLVRQSKAMALILEHRVDDRWREPIFLGLGTIQEGNPWLIESVLRRLIQRAEQDDTARWHRDLILAAEIGEDRDWASMQEQGLDVPTLQQELRQGLVTLLNDATQPISVTERLRAGTLLADLNDPRYPVTDDEWIESLRNLSIETPHASRSTHHLPYWCYIRPGTYTIGGWEDGEESADHNLPAFWIARYPITVAQYAAFIAAGGYDQQRYWTPQGWEWKQERNRTQPLGWDNTKYNSPNQAVIGVTWYECMAFCAWLTAQLADTLPAGYAVQLPTEAEWEAAVAYDAQMQRRTYPWVEDEPTPEYAIFEDEQGNNLGAPAPVGVCPAGSAACGALDMGGQVWEWCRSSHGAYPQEADAARAEFNRYEDDVPLRGGSWDDNRTSVRCAERLGGSPLIVGINLIYGFRVLFSPRVLPHSR
jgi:formylglycine-generating enzyme required for sulfatase activity